MFCLYVLIIITVALVIINKTNNNIVAESFFNYPSTYPVPLRPSMKPTPTYPSWNNWGMPWWNNWWQRPRRRRRPWYPRYCPTGCVYSGYDSNRPSGYKCMDFGNCPGPGYGCCRYDYECSSC
jgi:hypothetical protein